ncbi:MAG TPA: SDR family oxidoreductase [Pseudolabrys sp.]|nr:SDR family oxidoreductase [Pseudolabrys sp.]
MHLNGKVVLITGGSRGIGAATAERLSAEADVFLAANDTTENLQKVAAQCLARRKGGRVEFGIFDFLDENAAEAMIAAAEKAFGRIDVLVNNAAIRIRQPFGRFSHDEFNKMIAVNLRAPLFASQAVVPIMRRQGGGRIIHVASQMGEIAEDGSTLYGLTKAALIHLTRSMAFELVKDNIIVNAVSPGPTMTEYNEARTTNDPALKAKKLSYTPAGRYGRPEEIAEAIEFLAKTDASYIVGHNLVADGGYTIH